MFSCFMNPTDNISSLLIDHIMGMSIMIYRYFFYLSELIIYVSILRTIVYNRSIYFAFSECDDLLKTYKLKKI